MFGPTPAHPNASIRAGCDTESNAFLKSTNSVVELVQNGGQPGINFPSDIFGITESAI